MLPLSGNAQNEASFEQYHFNQLSVNPGYAGSQGSLEVTAMAHRQWVKIDGAPQTESVIIHSQLANGKIGIGGKLLHDVIGSTEQTSYSLDYAYRMYSNIGVWAVGIELAASSYNLNYSDLDAFQNGDPAFIGVPQQFMSFNAGAGLWFQNEHVFTGLSVPNLIEPLDTLSNVGAILSDLNLYDQSRHIFLTAGYLFEAGDLVAIQPSTLVRYDFNAPIVVDGNLSLIFKNTFWVGASYRTDGSISAMGEYFLDLGSTLKDQFVGIGYAYNQRLDDTQSIFGSTHEVFVTFQWNKKTTHFSSPRFF
jgi:type IX secretion system PorP/SprF family membrane protein